jgi:integrase
MCRFWAVFAAVRLWCAALLTNIAKEPDMPVVQFTPAFIASGLVCPTGKKKIEFSVADEPGLFVECRDSVTATPVWYLRLKNAQGTNTYKKLGTVKDLSLAQARKLAKQLRAEHTIVKQSVAAPTAAPQELTLARFFDEQYLPHAKVHKRSYAKDITLYRLRIAPKFGHLPLSAINRREVQKFHNDLLSEGLSPASCNHHVVLFRRMLNLACSWELLEKNVLRGIPLLPLDNFRENFLSAEETNRLVEVLTTDANKTVCAILLFLLNTGARRMEAIQAKWVDVDLENRLWKIPAANNKSKRPKSLPLDDSAMQILQGLESKGTNPYLFPNPQTGLPYSGIMRVWYRLRKKAGLDPDMRVHDLRACLAERLLSAGQSLFLVQKLLGHQDPRTTLRYARLSSKALLDASNIASVALPSVPKQVA